jgi:hypothetical protein
VASRFEGPAEVTGAIWSQVAASGEISILQSETGPTLDDPHPGLRHACSVRARKRARDVAHARIRAGHGDALIDNNPCSRRNSRNRRGP